MDWLDEKFVRASYYATFATGAFPMKAKWLMWALPAILAGCGGAGSGSPGETFRVPVPYQEVYRRAVDQAEYCLRSIAGYPVTGGVDTAARTSQMLVKGGLLGILAQVDARGLDDNSSEVTVKTAGINIWDVHAVRAMKDAIQFGVPSCSSYMPRTPTLPSAATVK